MGSRTRSARRWLSSAAKLLVVAAIAGFVVYRLRFAPVPVESHVAQRGNIVAEVMGTGTLESRISVSISSKISGRLVKLLVDQNDRVSKDQLLATLDDGDLRQQVAMAKAELAVAKAAVDRTAADAVRAEATALRTRTDFDRTSRLAKENINSVTATELDKFIEQRDVAEAGLKSAQAASVESQRQVSKAEETIRYYEERLADTKILSPFAGLVLRRSAEAGDVVVPGSVILQVISLDQMWISAWVDESAMSSLAADQPARVAFRSEPGRSYPGTVTRLSPQADRETREFLVDVTVKELPKTWAVGQRVEVYIQTAKKDDAVLVPQRMILWRGGNPGVFVEDAGHARWHKVSLGLRGRDTVEITDGIKEGDRVLLSPDPQNSPLQEGRAVKLP